MERQGTGWAIVHRGELCSPITSASSLPSETESPSIPPSSVSLGTSAFSRYRREARNESAVNIRTSTISTYYIFDADHGPWPTPPCEWNWIDCLRPRRSPLAGLPNSNCPSSPGPLHTPLPVATRPTSSQGPAADPAPHIPGRFSRYRCSVCTFLFSLPPSPLLSSVHYLFFRLTY